MAARDRRLFASESGGAESELIPVAGGRFEGMTLTAPIAFELAGAGRASALLTFELGSARWERQDPWAESERGWTIATEA